MCFEWVKKKPKFPHELRKKARNYSDKHFKIRARRMCALTELTEGLTSPGIILDML